MANYKKFLSFNGRAARSEYWAVYLLTWLFVFISSITFYFLLMIPDIGVILGGLFMLIIGIILAWLMIATAVRRCRDAGVSPWFVLSFLIPYVNFIVFVVFGCLPSDPESIEIKI